MDGLLDGFIYSLVGKQVIKLGHRFIKTDKTNDNDQGVERLCMVTFFRSTKSMRERIQ